MEIKERDQIMMGLIGGSPEILDQATALANIIAPIVAANQWPPMSMPVAIGQLIGFMVHNKWLGVGNIEPMAKIMEATAWHYLELIRTSGADVDLDLKPETVK